MDESVEKQVSRDKIGMNTAGNFLMNLISKGRNTLLQYENRESKTERNLKLSKESTLQTANKLENFSGPDCCLER